MSFKKPKKNKFLKRMFTTIVVLFSCFVQTLSLLLRLNPTVKTPYKFVKKQQLEEDERSICIPFYHWKGSIKCVDRDNEWCFVDQGCPWPRIPDSPEDVDTRFFLFTATPAGGYSSPKMGTEFSLEYNFQHAVNDQL